MTARCVEREGGASRTVKGLTDKCDMHNNARGPLAGGSATRGPGQGLDGREIEVAVPVRLAYGRQLPQGG